MKILILTAPYGSGHKKAAEAVKNAAIKKDIDVEVLDYYESFCNDFLIKSSLNIHSISFSSIGKVLYKIGFILSTNFYNDNLSSIFGIGRFNFSKFLKNNDYTDVVITFPIAAISKVKQENPNIAFHSIITDYSNHKKWLNKNLNNIFVGYKEIYKDMDNIVESGIPIFNTNKKTITSKYDFSNNSKVISILCGANGVNKNIEKYVTILKKEYNINIICGKNKTLFQNLKNKYKSTNINIFGYVDDMPNLYNSSDVILTKSGGLTCAELIFYKKNALFYKPQYGQETHNAQLFAKQNIGEIIDDDNIESQVKKIINSYDINKFNKLWHANSAEEIIERIQSGSNK